MTATGPEIAIAELLSQDSRINGLVGKRIYPLLPYESTKPYMLYSLAAVLPKTALGGKATQCDAEIDVSSVSDNYAEMKNLATAAFKALNGVTNTPTMPVLRNVHLVSESDEVKMERGGNVSTWVLQKFRVRYLRA